MDKVDILALPIFPKYKVEVNGNEVVHSSAVYMHYDAGDYVEVLLQPVKNMHILCKGVSKEMFLEQHLKHCLIMSKYGEITSDFREWLPCVARLDKNDPDFTHTLHFTYP